MYFSSLLQSLFVYLNSIILLSTINILSEQQQPPKDLIDTTPLGEVIIQQNNINKSSGCRY